MRCGEGSVQPSGQTPGRLLATVVAKEPTGPPQLFEMELTHAVELLTVTPRMGMTYRTSDRVVTFRMLLPKTEQHVYYFIDDKAEEVVVVTVWGVRRGRSPKLPT